MNENFLVYVERVSEEDSQLHVLSFDQDVSLPANPLEELFTRNRGLS